MVSFDKVSQRALMSQARAYANLYPFVTLKLALLQGLTPSNILSVHSATLVKTSGYSKMTMAKFTLCIATETQTPPMIIKSHS